MLIRQAFIDTILRQLLAKRTDPNFVNQIFCVQLRSPLVLPPIRFVLEHASLADFHSSALFPRFAAGREGGIRASHFCIMCTLQTVTKTEQNSESNSGGFPADI